MPTSLADRSSSRTQPPAPLRDAIAADWMLDPAIVFMNHGCFGVRPRSVFEHQHSLRERFERSPVQDLHFGRDDNVKAAKEAVGRFIGASPDNFAFLTNATGGVNTVLRSLAFEPGDEILTINHVYNAVRMAMRFVANQLGAKAIEVRVDMPGPDGLPQLFIDAIDREITSRTRLVIIDHITSPTALVLPVKDIIKQCEARGVDVLIDGAHAPGMVDLNVEDIGAAYYAGNLHKWGCAPVGCAFLWIRPDKQKDIHALTVSHFYEDGFPHEFTWQGTRDISPWLCAPFAIDWIERTYGWAKLLKHNHEMAVWAQRHLCEKWGVEPCSPLDGSMLGSMATLRLPGNVRTRYESAEAFQRVLFEKHGFEVPIVEWDEKWWLRVSCQVYNTKEQYERLGDVVAELVG